MILCSNLFVKPVTMLNLFERQPFCSGLNVSTFALFSFFHGLYGPGCPLSTERLLNVITHSLLSSFSSYTTFPELNADLFQTHRPPSLLSTPLKQTSACPNSPITRRTKQEIKSAQKVSWDAYCLPSLFDVKYINHIDHLRRQKVLRNATFIIFLTTSWTSM